MSRPTRPALCEPPSAVATSPALGKGCDDLALAHAAAGGDVEAFSEIAARHHAYLVAVTRGICDTREDAEDATLAALTSAWTRIHTFQGHSAVRTWLHRIAVNAALDLRRRRAVHPQALESLEILDDPTVTVASPVDAYAAADARALVTQMLDTLPEGHRRSVVLVDLLGYSVAEAALALGIAVGTVKSRRARAFRALAATFTRG